LIDGNNSESGGFQDSGISKMNNSGDGQNSGSSSGQGNPIINSEGNGQSAGESVNNRYQERDISWNLENYQGVGFTVINGNVIIDNPSNIRSFLINKINPMIH
jgi:hypothetical protein